ncbi:MAG TPA: 50S ribosomal protein L29 [Candidatus Paceibacterota bacterium]|nr:50S ribosomal protein L29 [Candidatus Paceibacterota bacterium]
MKAKDLRKESTEKLLKMKKDLEFGKIKASTSWGVDNLKKKESGQQNVKGYAKAGSKTSIQKDIRRNIARILTILKERENDNSN